MSDCLIIFTRYPEPGKTKTRLIPALGATGAAQLQQRLTELTLATASHLPRSIAVEVHFAGGDTQKMQDWLGQNLILRSQFSGDLGQRMAAAFREAIELGKQRVVMIGIDCPELTTDLIQKAFLQLQNNDLVLGKAVDGGYYLIGLRRFVPELFESINWGTETVLQQTVEKAELLNLSLAYLPTLRDLDTPEDWQYFQNFPSLNSNFES
ncbi:MAG: TIGR04282 family arsenosugar biosynthesis glycosyltransferase [Jaaginema sp. PMC 1080.18]|nr:TIGR04282 family arsenosugar biosynthesis glycosyltransferase [Jaaginema sp. PMC 1080.18]MEC4869122.1 TIGR04282 family arsenosugar biosynthesis glycosyltransferase [Jaaginema sp. PMC 1078.18]